MTLRKRVWLTFGIIVVIAILAGTVDWPKGPNIKIGSFTKELKVKLGLDLLGGTRLVYDADVSNIPASDRQGALDGVRDVIERRVNAFGVSEPVVQTTKVGDNWRVIVELPGIQDVNEAILLIGETPLLEFKEQKEVAPLSDEEKASRETFNASQKKKAEDVLKRALAGEDFAKLADEFSEDPGNTSTQDGSKKGGDLDFTQRGQLVPEFEDIIFDKLETGKVYTEVVESQFGYHIIKKTDERNNNGVREVRSSHILFIKKSLNPDQASDFSPTQLTGKQLKSATVQFDQNTGEPQVSLQFDSEGSKLFEEITQRNVGKVVGIFLDGSPISLPRVNEKISGGQAVITGKFTLDEAKQLAQRLNAGALPVPISLASQNNVGPTLGKISVERSFLAGILGLLFVSVFMIVYYRLPGLLSVVALTLYALIALMLFKLLSITLSLAGVAGFILSIGMAVDANILIFERTREELRAGRTLAQAIEEGFKRAWPSIRDSNASSLLSCLILAWFGTSVIKGFAITLAIGILVSMFSAITITRTFMRLLLTEHLQKKGKLFGLRETQKNTH